MGLWSSIKNIGKKAVNLVSGYFTGQPVFNSNTNTITGGNAKSIDWTKLISQGIGILGDIGTNTIPYVVGNKLSDQALELSKAAQERQWNYEKKGLALQNKYNLQNMAQQFDYNMQSQKQVQAWQEQMTNTAHQREVQDLRAAGLNPLLSAGGNGAGAGTSGTTTVGMGTTGDASVGLTDDANQKMQGWQTAIQANLMGAQIKNIQSEIAQRVHQTSLIEEQAEQARTSADYNKALKAFQDLKNDWFPKETQKQIEQIENNMKYQNAMASAAQVNAHAAITRAEIERLLYPTSQAHITAQTKAEEQMAQNKEIENEWNKKHPHLYSASRMSAMLMGMLGLAGVMYGKGIGGKATSSIISPVNATQDFYKYLIGR